jgi:hypothetical protein
MESLSHTRGDLPVQPRNREHDLESAWPETGSTTSRSRLRGYDLADPLIQDIRGWALMLSGLAPARDCAEESRALAAAR